MDGRPTSSINSIRPKPARLKLQDSSRRPNNSNQHARRRHGISFHLISFHIVSYHSFFSATCCEPGPTHLSESLPHLNGPDDTFTHTFLSRAVPRPVFCPGCYSSGKRVELRLELWGLCLSMRLVLVLPDGGDGTWGLGRVAAMRSWIGHKRLSSVSAARETDWLRKCAPAQPARLVY